MDISCLNYIYMCNSSFAIPYIPKYFFYIAKTMFSDWKAPKSDRKATKSGRKNPVFVFYEFLNFETEKFEISPENSFRVVPETEKFSEIQIFPRRESAD